MTVFCLIKNNKIENAIVATQEVAEKIKTEMECDDIIERTSKKDYSKDFIFDNLTSDFVNPSVIEKRESESG